MTMYYGNAAYCYANSASMLLATIGETVSPSLIEVLTGFSLGASHLNGMLFFDNCMSSPDKGINKAFKLLGFSVSEEVSQTGEKIPLNELKEALLKAPVLLGPLDMGYLNYNPNHPYLKGSDHYVLAIHINEDSIVLHDPSGYPYVGLALNQLELTWRADDITWSSGFFRYWHNPKRIAYPSEDELYKQAIHMFKADYELQRVQAYQTDKAIGDNAIRMSAQKIKDGTISNEEKSHLSYFAFPLGARRAIDYALFFNKNHKELSEIKNKQAQLLGLCCTLSTTNKWSEIAHTFEQLAELEAQFESAMLEVKAY